MKPIALVTGASGGIGAAVARRLAEHGYAVVLQYHHNRDAALSVASAFCDDTPYLCVACDLRSDDSVSKMVESIHQHLGTVSVLVNCAGVALPQMLFSDTTDEDYARVFDVNVRGTMRVTKTLLDDLRQHENAAVVNLSSIWGVSGGSCEVLYSASKAAIVGFSKALGARAVRRARQLRCARVHPDRDERASVRVRSERVLRRSPAEPDRHARGRRRRCAVPCKRAIHDRTGPSLRRRLYRLNHLKSDRGSTPRSLSVHLLKTRFLTGG